MKKLVLLIWVIFLFACNNEKGNILKDNNIDQSIRDEIATLDQQIVDALANNNADLIKDMMAEELKAKSGDSINVIIEQLSSYISENKYEIVNQFYTTNNKPADKIVLNSGSDSTKDYSMVFTVNNKDAFVSLLKLSIGYKDILVSIVYGKYNDEWKVNIIHFGLYAIHGKTANDYFASARKKYEAGYFMDAFMDMMVCMDIIYPAGEIFLYHNERKMHKFVYQIIDNIETQMTFPLPINDIQGKPQIVSIYPKTTDEGIFPLIDYYTTTSIDDTLKLMTENDAIHAIIEKYIPGITIDKKYVFYRAFNEMPDGVTNLPYYGMIQEQEKIGI